MKHETAIRKSPIKFAVLLCVTVLLVLTIGICVWLWHIVSLRPWLATFGTALRSANGHALYFEGEAYRGLKDYGEMLSAFRSYLFNADKDPAEAFEGDANACYDRPSGYCGERTAWIEHLLANYFFARAQRSRESEKTTALQQAVTEVGYMMKSRQIGFNADLTTRDTTDLLRETAEQLK